MTRRELKLRAGPLAPATVTCSHDGVNFELHQPLLIDETRYVHEGAGRSYLGEPFAVCARRLSPTGDVNQHDPVLMTSPTCTRPRARCSRCPGNARIAHTHLPDRLWHHRSAISAVPATAMYGPLRNGAREADLWFQR